MTKFLTTALLAGLMLASTAALAQTKTQPAPAPPATLAAGMEFFHTNSWQEVLAKAKAENKLIFVDVYAVWCGPCKMMAAKTFTHPDVGTYYNRNFINYKLDAEKGEGPALAGQWRIEGYPSFLFLNHKGEIVYRGIGYMPPAEFLTAGQDALNAYADKGVK